MTGDERAAWTQSITGRLVVGFGAAASVSLALLDLGLRLAGNLFRFEEFALTSMVITTVGALAIATRLPSRVAWSTGVGLAVLSWVFLLGFVPRTDHFARRVARSSLFDGIQAETALWLLGTGRVEDARWYDLGPGVEEPALHDDWHLGPHDRSVLLLKVDTTQRIDVVRILRALPHQPSITFDADGWFTGPHGLRLGMAAGLIASERLPGLPATEVEALLGSPDGSRRFLSFAVRASLFGRDRYEVPLDDDGCLHH